MLSLIIVFYSFHMGKTSFRFGIYYCKCEKRFGLLDNDRIISHSKSFQTKHVSPDGNKVNIFDFVVYFDIMLETLIFHLQTKIFERPHLKEVFPIVWSMIQLRNQILSRETNFQLNLRHSCCHRHNTRRCHHHFTFRCYFHYFPRYVPSRIRILPYFTLVFLPSQFKRSQPCMLLIACMISFCESSLKLLLMHPVTLLVHMKALLWFVIFAIST